MTADKAFDQKHASFKKAFKEILKAKYASFETYIFPERYISFVDEAKRDPTYWIKFRTIGFDSPDGAQRNFSNLANTLASLGSTSTQERINFWENQKRAFIKKQKALRKIIKELNHAIQKWAGTRSQKNWRGKGFQRHIYLKALPRGRFNSGAVTYTKAVNPSSLIISASWMMSLSIGFFKKT